MAENFLTLISPTIAELMKTRFTKTLSSILVALTALAAITYSSCNKSNDKSTTTTKCIVCAYGGSCINDTCRCLTGYEGPTCETISREVFFGNWQVFEKGSNTNTSQYGVSIQSSSAGISNVIISNFYNYFTQPVQAVINKDTITIPNQEMQGKVIFGVGFMNPTTTGIADQALTLRYEVIDTATGTVNDFGYYPADGSNASSWNK